MGHVEDRAKERTTLTEADIAKARAYVKANRKQFKKDQTYSIVAPNRKGYYIVGDVGEKRKKHVIKTVYGANMRPPGTIIQNAKLEHDLIKAADALFSLEKTASAVSYSVALMEYDKLASAYFGYELDEWLEYPEEMRKEAFVTLQRAGANLLQRGSKLLGGNQTLARGSANLRAKAAKGLERQSTLTSNVDKATRLQAEAAEQSSRAAQQARIGGNTELASRQAAHAERQVADAQANFANRTRAAREQGEAAYRSNVSPNMSAPEIPRSVRFDTIKPAPQQRPINMTPRQQQTVVNYNTNVRKAGTDAVEGLGRSNQGYAQARNSVRKAESAVANRAQPNTNVVSSKAPKAPAQPNANTGGGANTGGTPPPPPPPPATDAAKPVNWKNVGYGALGTTALAAGGYGGYKMYQNKKQQQQQMGMPKMASWYSFVDKTASYSDALGMYKEALSRADKNLLKEYQKAEEAARKAVKQEGKALVEMQKKYRAMPKGPERDAAREAFKKAQQSYNFNLNNQPTVESFLKNKGYKGDELKATQGKLKGKLFGQRNQAAMRNAVLDQSQIARDLKYNTVEPLENMSKKLERSDALFDDARRAAGKKPQKLRLGARQAGMSHAFNAEARAEKFLKRKGVDITTPAGEKELRRLTSKLHEAATTKRNKKGRAVTSARTYGPNTPYHFDPETGAPRSRAAKRQIAALSLADQADIANDKSFLTTERAGIASKLDQVDRGVDRRGIDALKNNSANLQQQIELEELSRARAAQAKAQAAVPPQPTPTPTPAAQPKAPLPNAADVNPQQAAEQAVKNTTVPPKPASPPPVAEVPKAPTGGGGTAKTVATTADDAAKAAIPKAAPKGRLGMLLGGTALAGGTLLGLNAMRKNNEQEKAAEVQYRGRTFPGYNKPMKSDRPNKKKMVLAKKGDKVKLIHYGHSGYKHNYSKGAKKNYLTRSAGIRNKSGKLTMNDKFSANYWARRDLWPQGQKADGSDKKR